MGDLPNAETPALGNGKKNGKIKPLIAVAVIALGAIFGVYHYVHGLTREETDDAFLEARVVPVSSRVAGHVLAVHVNDNQDVKAGDLIVEIDQRDFQLRLERAKAALEVARARERSSLKSVDFTRSNSGAGMGEAESGVQRADAVTETLKAGVEAAKSRIAMATAQVSVAEAQVLQVESEVVAVESREALALSEKKRYSDLLIKDIVTAQQFDQIEAVAKAATAELSAVKAKLAAAKSQAQAAKAAEQAAKVGLTQAEAQLNEAQSGVNQAKARLDQAKGAQFQVGASVGQAEALRADVVAAEAAVRQAELDLSYTKVVAPESGRVTKKSIEKGSFVQPGQALMALVSKEMWVVANFKETQLTDMRVGQKALVKIDAFPDREFSAHVDSLQLGTGARFSLLPPENATGNYVKIVQRLPVKLTFDEPLPKDLPLGPGMSVQPVIFTK